MVSSSKDSFQSGTDVSKSIMTELICVSKLILFLSYVSKLRVTEIKD